MTEAKTTSDIDERISRQAPQLIGVLKEMKEGLDTVRSKVQALTTKVKANQFPTADGISYLEAKHLLLLNYCQSLVYYLLRKAKGLSIDGHPVVQSLVEIRLFLEKIRPIDKKMQYQIQKLTRVTESVSEKSVLTEKGSDTTQKEDLLKYRPNPDMLTSKTTLEDSTGVYRPPKLAPAIMDEDKTSRQERNALRKEQQMLRQAKQSTYMKELIDDIEGRPEEWREVVGTESRELKRYMAKMEKREQQEEEQFTRAPLTKLEKKKMKHLKKSRNGLLGLTESFYDEIKTLPFEEGVSDQKDLGSSGTVERKQKKRKRRN
ncbi:PREDICTED: neuroguidin [Ipomoea nil]|uniref:neuroguidin n=1 Tax=Ipomoea nil TaxID=35883 RepID=UPI00090084F5|nr:PREDICTED: neuroguidin [Ipomoea nil]